MARKTVRWTGVVWMVLLFSPIVWGQSSTSTQTLPVRYEEMTSLDFLKALDRSARTCLIPLGILEKHGPHLPIGTDLLDARETSLRAVAQEYALVFPPYYFGQIFEARHQPGTIAYSSSVIWQLLQETCDELARNGIQKIILVNGHGGNNSFIHYFAQAQLASRKNYALYIFEPASDPETEKKIQQLKKTSGGEHAGEEETSTIMSHRPELVQKEKATMQSGADQHHLDNLTDAYTAIWWYARYPNHYAGEGAYGNAELGKLILDSSASQLAKMIAKVKKDTRTLELQNEFFNRAEKPTQTPQ